MRVAAVQLSSGNDVRANVDRALELIEHAANEGATYVQVPEYFNYLGSVRRYREVAESIPGPTTELFAELARRRGITVHLGSMIEVSPVPERYYNTSVVIGPDARVCATYRKIHLFDIDVPGEVVHRESDALVAGDALVLAGLDGAVLGLSICFDLRFPELYRRLARAGAQILAVPSAFTAHTGRAHWAVLVRARAIENHAFVVAAAQVGATAEGVATYGHSMIVDPWGEVLAESTSDGPDVLVRDIDLDQVARRRAQIDVLALARDDLYAARVAGPASPGLC